MTQGLSVEDIIKQVLPQGTILESQEGVSWTQPPDYPPDLFAVVGVLLQRSGAYQYVISAENADPKGFPDGSMAISAQKRQAIVSAGRAWSTGAPPQKVKNLWSILYNCKNPVYNGDFRAARPKWLMAAIELFAIADEACFGAGYFIPTSKEGPAPWVAIVANAILEKSTPKKTPATGHIKHHDDSICSITSVLVDVDMVCVQPKSRTPGVGCSLRNMSRNLALLPPRGQMKVHWLTPPSAPLYEHSANLNLLLVPYPYRIENEWIKTDIVCDEDQDGWGWFEIQQRWLERHENDFISFVDALLSEASATTKRKINGLVFPEYSLNYGLYEKLAEHLRDNHPSFDFLVAGTSQNCNLRAGNFAMASHFYKVDTEKRAMATVSRAKHHRWSLDTGQIESYGLTSAFRLTKSVARGSLNSFRWWESIPIYPRRLHVNALRDSSVFTALICEDLARSEPVHEPLKSVGANIIFVLLMDGPQKEWRWAGRYSTGLAEDPGSSVMTLTSRALVERWNAGKPEEERSFSVGLWKDSRYRAKEILCPPTSHAVVVELTGNSQLERTVDGRESQEAFSWTIASEPVQIELGTSHAALAALFCA